MNELKRELKGEMEVMKGMLQRLSEQIGASPASFAPQSSQASLPSSPRSSSEVSMPVFAPQSSEASLSSFGPQSSKAALSPLSIPSVIVSAPPSPAAGPSSAHSRSRTASTTTCDADTATSGEQSPGALARFAHSVKRIVSTDNFKGRGKSQERLGASTSVSYGSAHSRAASNNTQVGPTNPSSSQLS
ncbi:hypothetical protein BD309DRAFT_1024541 [Dichomitus squalens]|nr:hypothetical protein BD309DRAFT_1024541 [Dichomitus squalens]